MGVGNCVHNCETYLHLNGSPTAARDITTNRTKSKNDVAMFVCRVAKSPEKGTGLCMYIYIERNLCASPKNKARAQQEQLEAQRKMAHTNRRTYPHIFIYNRQSKQNASENSAISDSE